LILPQQGCPHTRRPSGHSVGASPGLQVTLQLPTMLHVTEQRASQVTSQLPTLVHTAEPPSPSRVAHLLALSHEYTHPAPQRASHWLALTQRTAQSAPQSIEQLSPFRQSKSHLSVHVALQLSAPLQVGSQATMS
jgi:hypothetical protein